MNVPLYKVYENATTFLQIPHTFKKSQPGIFPLTLSSDILATDARCFFSMWQRTNGSYIAKEARGIGVQRHTVYIGTHSRSHRSLSLRAPTRTLIFIRQHARTYAIRRIPLASRDSGAGEQHSSRRRHLPQQRTRHTACVCVHPRDESAIYWPLRKPYLWFGKCTSFRKNRHGWTVAGPSSFRKKNYRGYFDMGNPFIPTIQGLVVIDSSRPALVLAALIDHGARVAGGGGWGARARWRGGRAAGAPPVRMFTPLARSLSVVASGGEWLCRACVSPASLSLRPGLCVCLVFFANLRG